MAFAPWVSGVFLLLLSVHSLAQSNLVYESGPEDVYEGAYDNETLARRELPAVPAYQVVVNNALTAAMHSFLTCDGKLVILDRRNKDSPENLPVCKANQVPGKCKTNHLIVNKKRVDTIMWDMKTKKYTPLDSITDVFCSGGTDDADGNLLVIGGSKTGVYSFRRLKVGSTQFELLGNLKSKRWYPYVIMLPNAILVVGGSQDLGGASNPTLEYWPATGARNKLFPVKMLERTAPENLYPLTTLIPDGKVFILGYASAIIWDWKLNTETDLPDLPPFTSRNYHFAGGFTLLPLTYENGYRAEVFVCGGASVRRQMYNTPATNTCGRMCLYGCPVGRKYKWDVTDKLFRPRHMGFMVIGTDLKVYIHGGAQQGISQFKNRMVAYSPADKPNFTPEIYNPRGAPGKRMVEDLPTTIPRLYHSSCILNPAGKMWIMGSNPNNAMWTFKTAYPTEFRIEEYTPPYLRLGLPQPTLTTVPATKVKYGTTFRVRGTVPRGAKWYQVKFVCVKTGFSTHGLNQGQRALNLPVRWRFRLGRARGWVEAPPSFYVAPAGCYYCYITYRDVPCVEGKAIRFGI